MWMNKKCISDKSTNNFFKVTKDVKLKVTAKDTSGFCSFVDSAEIVKVDANPRLFVDTISNCASNNLFKFVDSLTLKNDLISHRILRYSQFSKAYKNSSFDHHFNKAGKFDAYIDVFPARSACKYTYVIPINIRQIPGGQWLKTLQAHGNKLGSLRER